MASLIQMLVKFRYFVQGQTEMYPKIFFTFYARVIANRISTKFSLIECSKNCWFEDIIHSVYLTQKDIYLIWICSWNSKVLKSICTQKSAQIKYLCIFFSRFLKVIARKLAKANVWYPYLSHQTSMFIPRDMFIF